MSPEEVRKLVEEGITDAQVEVLGSGDRFRIRVVSDAFEGKRKVQRQQLVYGCINHLIRDGSIHAVELETLTPQEWQQAGGDSPA